MAGKTLADRLAQGTVLGAEGYVFELERRGYIKAGAYVPEVVLDFPGAVTELHREFLRAGADVMVALTCCSPAPSSSAIRWCTGLTAGAVIVLIRFLGRGSSDAFCRGFS